MPRSPSLTVVVPRLLERLRRTASEGSELELTVLAELAGRGDIARRWYPTHAAEARLRAWQRGLLAMLGLEAGRYPSAPISARGRELDHEAADWLHVEPIHLAAGLNEVTLVPLWPEFALSSSERDALTDTLKEHVESGGATLHAGEAGEWLLGWPTTLDATSVVVNYAMRGEWNEVMPQGTAAPQLRRAMTELQMILHEHPINVARAARGVPAANSVWLWGNGVLEERSAASNFVCLGENDYLRGLCRANAWSDPVPAESADRVLSAAGDRTICVLPELRVVEFARDWLTPFAAALRKGELERLELVLDDWLLTIDRWRLKRLWRRPLPLERWALA